MKPMLAVDVTDFQRIRYPVFGSPKIDGVRAVMTDRFRPRSLKVFPNVHLREHFDQHRHLLQHFDGELVLRGHLGAANLCRATSSAVSSIEGEPLMDWHLFDLIDETMSFEERVKTLKRRFSQIHPKVRAKIGLHLIPQTVIRSPAEAEAFEHEQLARGAEGVVWKSKDGLYKFGRGTMIDQTFMRTKRFEDAEGRVVGFQELMRNGNVATRNELGHQVRSHHQANKQGGGQLGALEVKVLTGPLKGQTFELGTGFDQATRIQLWTDRRQLVGRVVKFKYFAHGVKDKPRWPSFQGFRDAFDR